MELDATIDNLFARTARDLAERVGRNARDSQDSELPDTRAFTLTDGWKQYIRTGVFPVFINDGSFEDCLLQEAEKLIPAGQRVRAGFYDAGVMFAAGSAGISAGGDYVPGAILGLFCTYLFAKAKVRETDIFEMPRKAIAYLRSNPDSFESHLRSAQPLVIKEFRNHGHLSDLA